MHSELVDGRRWVDGGRRVDGGSFEWPITASANVSAILLAAAALVATLRFGLGLLPLLGRSALIGMRLGIAGLS